MRRQAIIGALLLIGVGVVLGTTVFRADIAQATGLGQSVTVVNSRANPVTVASSGAKAHKFVTLEYLNGVVDQTFPAIRASLITFYSDLTSTGTARVDFLSKGVLTMSYLVQIGDRVVLPLPAALSVDEISVSNCLGGLHCLVEVNMIG